MCGCLLKGKQQQRRIHALQEWGNIQARLKKACAHYCYKMGCNVCGLCTRCVRKGDGHMETQACVRATVNAVINMRTREQCGNRE